MNLPSVKFFDFAKTSILSAARVSDRSDEDDLGCLLKLWSDRRTKSPCAGIMLIR